MAKGKTIGAKAASSAPKTPQERFYRESLKRPRVRPPRSCGTGTHQPTIPNEPGDLYDPRFTRNKNHVFPRSARRTKRVARP
jgi:hypothetical protein